MIERAGEPEAVTRAGDIWTWRVAFNEAPSCEWRRRFLEQAYGTGPVFAWRVRVEDAHLLFEVDRTALRIALARIDGWIAEANAAYGSAATDSAAAGQAGTILVVDDSPEVRNVTRDILASRGYTVVDTGDPREALRIAETRTIRLLLTDVVMPEMNGRELAERFALANPQARVLFMSACPRATLAPGTPVLAKPFSVENLLRVVREAFDR